MDPQELQVRHLLHSSKLGRLAPALDDLLRPAIRLQTQPHLDTTMPSGTTRLGGQPDLPTGVCWEDLPFIAQLRLPELAVHDHEGLLPQVGLLSFFCDLERSQQPPRVAPAWSVLYHSEQACLSLQAAPFPETLPFHQRYSCHRLAGSREMTLPSLPSLALVRLGFNARAMSDLSRVVEMNRYLDLWYAVAELYGNRGHQGAKHQLLGHPDELLGEMQQQCQRESQGWLRPGGSGDAEEAALAWRLLLQVDMGEISPSWHEHRRLYYWIREGDLARRDYAQVWLVVQPE